MPSWNVATREQRKLPFLVSHFQCCCDLDFTPRSLNWSDWMGKHYRLPSCKFERIYLTYIAAKNGLCDAFCLGKKNVNNISYYTYHNSKTVNYHIALLCTYLTLPWQHELKWLSGWEHTEICYFSVLNFHHQRPSNKVTSGWTNKRGSHVTQMTKEKKQSDEEDISTDWVRVRNFF